MQERRTLVYLKEDDIPSSAVAWDGSTVDSPSGNVFYIPVFSTNSNGCSGSIYTKTNFPLIRYGSGFRSPAFYSGSTALKTIPFTIGNATISITNDKNHQFGWLYSAMESSELCDENSAGNKFFKKFTFNCDDGITLKIRSNNRVQFISPYPIVSSYGYANGSWSEHDYYLDTALYPDAYFKIKISVDDPVYLKLVSIRYNTNVAALISGRSAAWEHPIYIDNE